MERSTNALAELAEELDRVMQALGYSGHPYYFEVVRKAQRIVAELAKNNISLIPQECCGCGVLKSLANCRAIAEEGAKDGK